MASVLGHPKFGYYINRDVFGSKGDFTTAPEISQMFGEIIGLWISITWQQMGKPDPVQIIELGPGRGTLIADALRAMNAQAPELAEVARVSLVETSPVLTALQVEKLATVSHKGAWYKTFADVPKGPMILIANEFFDALPIRQYQFGEEGWAERGVAYNKQSDEFEFRSLNREILPFEESELQSAPKRGDIFEFCPMAHEIVRQINQRLQTDGGAALIIDYGHPKTAVGETLQAVKNHQFHNLFDDPGEADLTAHVDFQSLARSSNATTNYGPKPQGAFLLGLGIQLRAQGLMSQATPEQQKDIESGLRRLTDADKMGQLFKVMAFTNPTQERPAGFENDKPVDHAPHI